MNANVGFAVNILFTFVGCLMITCSLIAAPSPTVSAYMIDLTTGEILHTQQADQKMIPASSLKIVTTGAALHVLGPDFRFQTDLAYSGTIDTDGTLHGNLYIVGGGDPCLGTNWQSQLATWVDASKKAGIQRILGRVLADASRWEKNMAVPSWTWEDLGNYYGAGASALSFHENAYTLTFQPGKNPGEPTIVLETDPPIEGWDLHNEVTTGPMGSGDCACIYGMEYSPVQFVRGTVPTGVDRFSIKGAIPDSPSYCASRLTQALKEADILIEDQARFQTSRTVIHRTFSPTVGEIVRQTNQRSMNLYAEHLLKAMGEIALKEGSTDAGRKALTNFWQKQGITFGEQQLHDGSGLSRKNNVSARQLVDILLHMKRSEHAEHFVLSLPEKTKGIRAKSGFMTGVRGLAGYAGNTAFAIIVNHADSTTAQGLVDEFLKIATANNTQPASNSAPPIGVMAPIQRTPVNANR